MLVWGFLFGSCSDESFTVGSYLVEPRTISGMIDTVTIKVSNMVAADSVITSGRGNGFSGAYYDAHTGVIETQTFIEFSRTMESENNRFAVFDSVTLVLRPNGSFFGDTLARAVFNVFNVLNPIEKHENGNLYSTSTIPPEDTELLLSDWSNRIKVQDITNNEFEIKLPGEFGEWLFQGILWNDDDFRAENFLKTFPGLSLGAGTGSNCVHGFNLQDTACMIKIYYHISTTSKEDKIMTFRANPHNSFYSLSNDKSNINVEFHTKSDPVPSSETDNKGYVMSGTPMYTRLEFPHLNELLWLGQIVKIKRATLFVRPILHSYETVPLPPRLNIFYFDPTSNTPLSGAIRPPAAGGSNVGPQNGNLPENYQMLFSPNFPQYSFDVTDFIASQLGKAGSDKWALSLVIPDDTRESTLQRLVFGNQNYWYRNEIQSRDNRIKLEIIYVAYND